MKILDYLRSYDEVGIFNRHWWRDFYYTQISSRLRPRQRWLTKKIPRTWVDKDTILEIAVLESLKHYVEGEDCFNVLSTTNPPVQAEFMAKVKHYYELATVKLPALEKELEAEWDRVPPTDLSNLNMTKLDYEATYGKIDRLEKEIHDLQTEIMVWVVKERGGLWT